MIPMPVGTQIWVACGATDMRKGFDGLAMLAQEVVKRSPPFWPSVCVPRQAGGSHQDTVVGRDGAVPLREAVGARPLRLATDARRSRNRDAGAVIDAVRGD